ncbi:hypothetical protein C5S36_15865 [Candidatus Methanophagaceae archaeon]|nr:hypothetical protein C5S36_15865 [Methanophagales archaeon]
MGNKIYSPFPFLFFEYSRQQEAKEDFERPPKTSEYTPKVYKGWNGNRSKSKYSKELLSFYRRMMGKRFIAVLAFLDSIGTAKIQPRA